MVLIREHSSSIDFEWPIADGPVRPYGADPQLLGSSTVQWGRFTIDAERMRRFRLQRAKEQLEKNGVGAILAIDAWNNQYLTMTTVPQWTVPGSGLRYALYATTLDEAILYEQGEIGYHARGSCPWLHKVKVAITGAGWIGRTMGPHAFLMQTDKMVRQVVGDMEDAGLDPTQDVLAIDTYDPVLIAAFEKAGVTVDPNGAAMMLEARKIKGPDEVECLRVTCAVGDAMFEALRDNLRPGIRENELVALMHQRCYDVGGRIYAGVFVASGPAAWPNPRDESDRVIEDGDIVYADVYNTSFMGYKVCYYRTFSCGKASQLAKDDYSKSLDWLYNAIDAIKPGATTRDLAEQWPPCDEIWKDIHVYYEDQTAGSNWGHGCGLTLYEPPIIWRAVSFHDPVPLEVGMTFAVETQHGTPGEHGVRIEEMVRVTDTGVEVLSEFPVEGIIEVV